MKKTKYKSSIKTIIALVVVFSIIFLNSFSLIASGYGADINGQTSCNVYIRNVASGKYLTVPGGTVSNGKEIKIYDATEDVSQQWTVCEIIVNNVNYYYIRSRINSNYVLALENGSDTNGANIVLKYVSVGSSVPESAHFIMLSVPDTQCVYLLSRLSVTNIRFRGMDCKNDGSSNGTNVVQYDLVESIDDGASQMWVFEDIDRNIELSSWDLVDSGGHCDWDCSTQYSAMVRKAANAWNAYIGDEVFRPDSVSVVQDVKIKDMDTDPTGKGSFAATYSNNILANGIYASSICFYTDEMEKMDSDLQRQKTVMHELGHALGLYENRLSTSTNKLGNVMQQGALPYGTCISLDDRASVEQAYEGF